MNKRNAINRMSAAVLGVSFVAFSLATFSYRAAAVAFFLFFLFLLSTRSLMRPTLSLGFLFGAIVLNALVFAVSMRHEVHPPYVVKYFGMFGYFFLLLIYRRRIPENVFLLACRYFIYMHSLSLIAQLIWFVGTGSFLDLNNYIREEYANTIYTSRAMEGLIIPIRATGFFSEPSFYSMTVFPVALLLTLYEKKISAATMAGTITSFISLSVAGIVVILLGCVLFMFATKKRRSLRFGFIAVMIAMTPIAYEVYQRRVVEAVDYDAVGSRMYVIEYLRDEPFVDSVFGNGLLWNENKPIGDTRLWALHVRDSSFFIYMFFTSGAVGLFSLFSFLFVFLKKTPYLFLSIIISFLFKFGILVSVLWLMIAVALCLNRYSAQRDGDGA